MREKNRANPMRSPLSMMRGGIEIQVEMPQDLTRGKKKTRTRSMDENIKTPKIKYVIKILYCDDAQ